MSFFVVVDEASKNITIAIPAKIYKDAFPIEATTANPNICQTANKTISQNKTIMLAG